VCIVGSADVGVLGAGLVPVFFPAFFPVVFPVVFPGLPVGSPPSPSFGSLGLASGADVTVGVGVAVGVGGALDVGVGVAVAGTDEWTTASVGACAVLRDEPLLCRGATA
jgi:hypothetical protein